MKMVSFVTQQKAEIKDSSSWPGTKSTFLTAISMTFKEIATYLNKPLGTVQWQYNEAMKKLRKEISKDAYGSGN